MVPLLNDYSRRSGLSVVTGTNYLNSGGQAHKVENMWYHENYNENLGRSNFDIGLLKVQS